MIASGIYESTALLRYDRNVSPAPIGKADIAIQGGAFIPSEGESTVELLRRSRNGDGEALNTLLDRYLGPLNRWASGRLPRWARSLVDTGDLIQETLLHSLGRIDSFEPRSEGALQAYLRQAILNRIRDEIRRARRNPVETELPLSAEDPGPSPLEETLGREVMHMYEAALQRLRPRDREAIVARVEMGLDYVRVAESLQIPSANAAQMAVGRALLRLAREMRNAK